jgi:hypothetical protein
MAYPVVIKVVSGSPRPWTYYCLYCDGARYYASPRSQSELGWGMGHERGLLNGIMVEYVAMIRTRSRPDDFTHVYPCGRILVVKPEDDVWGQPQELQVDVVA